MEPRIRYARTIDGLNIAYAIIGSGPPVVYARGLTSPGIEFDADRLLGRFANLLMRNSMVIWDGRNFGLSDTSVTPVDMDTLLADMEAVVEELPSSPVDVLGSLASCHVAMAYSSRHPERVRRLGLWNPWTGAAGSPGTPLDELRRADFGAWADLFSLRVLGWEQAEAAQRMAESIKRSWTAESYDELLKLIEELDTTAMAPGIKIPALVLFERNVGASPLPRESVAVIERSARRLAAMLPEAQLAIVEDATSSPSVFERFFSLDEPDQAETAKSLAESGHGTALILFADIADSTALTESLGDKAFREKARELDSSLRAIIREHSGTCIDAKTLGDGVLATFASAAQAIEAALACGKAGADAGLPLHLGLHAGDVIREENNVFGGAVNIAARISGLSAAGELLVSDTVRSLARTSAGVSFEDRGEQSLKGVGEPVRVFAVRQA